MKQLYPGYNVLDKRHTPSWDPATRAVIEERLALPRQPRFCDAGEWSILEAICARILPQPGYRPAFALAALVDDKLHDNRGDGYRDARLPPLRQAWHQGLAALDAEALAKHGRGFARLAAESQDALLRAMQQDELSHPAWGPMPCGLFFSQRLLHDLTSAYYGHPDAWNDIGFGGPANPRGYVRLGPDSADPWEAVEARPGMEAKAEYRNRHVR
ncbi:gluconate 2-dehydrogenase subunit 3 family protein [Stutzerimonas tarimensis]|uniref:Gluconate 2-dehydrogenase subunit 3 family protein n=1 Tax=Stutzerimonas tarimensis TaxID=1507735 RepID=A0ABV7T8V5_9GAMM